jgi:hypothetical protein
MVSDSKYKRLEYWVEECQSKGKLAFSLAELKQSFENDSETSLKRVLDRFQGLLCNYSTAIFFQRNFTDSNVY